MFTKRFLLKFSYAVLITVLLALSAVSPKPAQAAGNVLSCTQAALTSALSGGGTVTFGVDCSSVPIVLTSSITIASNTTIDAGTHQVVISGGNRVRVFSVNTGVTLTLNGVTITNGAAGAEDGGAVRNLGTLIVNNSAFTNNTSLSGNGGAIFLNGGTATITNSTFSGNVTYGTGQNGLGGAIYSVNGNLTLANSTLSGNAAQPSGGGGVFVRSQSGNPVTTIRNTILSNNQGGNCAVNAATITNGGGNLVFGDATPTCPAASTADPQLSSLGQYGSNTPIFALQTGSPAIGLSTTNCPAKDQRGVNRSTPSCDSGSYEYRIPTSITVTSLVNPATYGDDTTFQATVSPSVATGTVRVFADDILIGSGPVNSGVASITTSVLTAGDHAITVRYLGDNAYEISDGFLAENQVINRAPLTIKADDKSRAYGANNPAFTFTASGFVNKENSSVFASQPTCSSDAVASSPVSGSPYPITCTGGSAANYDFNYVPGQLTIIPTMLTVTANNASRAYGAANPSFTYSITGFRAGDTQAVLTEEPTCSSTADATSPVTGSPYAITCTGGAAPNYGFTYQPGQLTITQVAVNAQVDNASRAYGAANPAFTVTYTGFLNGDDESVLTHQPVCNTTATATSAAGTSYPINCSGTTAVNYTFNFHPGVLSITKAPVVVTADNKSRTYGSANPTLTASYAGFANGETAAVLTHATSCTTPATASSPVSGSPYAITCSDATAANYTFTYQPGELTVNPAVLNVTADNKSKPYASENPELTYTFSGFVNSEGPAALTTLPVCETTAELNSPISGSPYPITCSGGAAANYTLVYHAGGLTITPAVLTLTAGNASRAYGASNPNFTYSVTGFVDGEDQSVVTTEPICNTKANGTSPVSGSPYAIECGGAVAANYVFSYKPGQLTITPALVTITGQNTSRVYGEANPTFSAVYAGFANGETSAVLTHQPTCTSPAVSNSPVKGGPYPINCSGATAANYTFTYQAGELTINPAVLTVKADNKMRNYREPNPELTYTVTGFKNGEDQSVLSGAPTLDTSAVYESRGGSYPIFITQGTLSADNYTFTFVNGTLSVLEYRIFMSLMTRP